MRRATSRLLRRSLLVVALVAATVAASSAASACSGASAAEKAARFAADTATIPGTVSPTATPATSNVVAIVDSTATGGRRGVVMLPSWAAEWQGDSTALGATTPWLGLVLEGAGASLAPVPVRRFAVEDVCFSEDTTKTWTDRLEADRPGVVLALWGESGLVAGPVAAGQVLDQGEFGAFSDPNDGGRVAPGGVRAVFRDDTLRFREEPVGDGFRVVVRWRGADEVLYETEHQDEGGWNVRWVGDLDRDEVPDILLDATRKYSVEVTWLHLSGGTSHGPRWRAVARYAHSAC